MVRSLQTIIGVVTYFGLGAALTERDESLNTPLIWACRNGHVDMADLLLHLVTIPRSLAVIYSNHSTSGYPAYGSERQR